MDLRTDREIRSDLRRRNVKAVAKYCNVYC